MSPTNTRSDALTFLGEFVKNPINTGSLLPSSKYLAKSLTPYSKISDAKLIVELGPGSGRVTGEILDAKPNSCKYLGIDINPKFISLLKHRYPDEIFVCGNACDLSQILKNHNVSAPDIVVCSLPLSIMSESLTYELLRELNSNLNDEAMFSYFTYIQSDILLKNKYFDCTIADFMLLRKKRIIYRNIPPAIIRHFQKV